MTLSEVKQKIKEHNMQPGSDSVNRKRLEEGIEITKNRIKFNDAIKSGLNVNDMKGWVDNLIMDKLGGKRIGLKVHWDNNGKIITWDPITNEFIESNVESISE